MSGRNGAGSRLPGDGVAERTATVVSLVLGDRLRVMVPDPAAPFWRCRDGTRHSYRSLRCGPDADDASVLRAAHLAAIERIAGAALAAHERGDQCEAARLAIGAGRLCQEIAGLWPPSAVDL